MKRVARNFIIAFVILFTCSFLLFAFTDGLIGTTRKNGSGCFCHGPASENVTVSILGPDTLRVNQTAAYTVRITGGPAVRGGTNIAASDGILNPLSSSLRSFGGELTHQSPTPFSVGVLNFQFTYTAPLNAGTQTLFANGNSVNFDGSTSGDEWNFAPDKRVTVVANITSAENERGSTPLRFSLSQNYPNPFNPTTKIQYSIARNEIVSLKVYDASGREVVALVNEYESAGNYEVDFNARNLSSGIYVFRLTTSNFSESKKMLLVK